jgi:hypothetical protein
VDGEDLLPPGKVGPVDHYLPVEAPRPQQRRVEDVRPVRRREHDDAALGVEAVHLDEQLVEGLLALVVTAAKPCAPLPADRVDLVHKDDARRVLLGLLEEVPDPGGADADEHLDKVRAEMLKNGTPASPATARASSVLPVPGGPTSSAPLGILAPSFWNFCGLSRNSLISVSSWTASSRRPRRRT